MTVQARQDKDGTWRIWIRSMGEWHRAGERLIKGPGHPRPQWTWQQEEQSKAEAAAQAWERYIAEDREHRRK